MLFLFLKAEKNFCFFYFPLPLVVRIHFAPHSHRHTSASHPTKRTRCSNDLRARDKSAHGLPERALSTRSDINGLHSGLSYLFGWLGTCTQLSPPLKEEPVRIIECLLVYRSRHCLCACVDLAQKQHHPVGNVVRHRFESERL